VDADGTFGAGDLIEGLRVHGIAVHDGFLSASQVAALGECASVRRGRGDFSPARIGAGFGVQRREDIRGDSICWLEEPLFPAEHEWLALMEQVRVTLNRTLFLGLDKLEQHYAHYPAGSGYARHVDQPQGRGARRLSSIVYLNPSWHGADGGQLRCRADDGEFRDIEPLGGRLVLFLTEAREHEVRPAVRERLSISGWFLGRTGLPR
jgi:SM-20-related protein